MVIANIKVAFVTIFDSEYIHQVLNVFVIACQCNLDGTIHDHDGDHDHHEGEVASCSATGQCACKDNIAGDKCDQCASGYSMNGFPACQVWHKLRLYKNIPAKIFFNRGKSLLESWGTTFLPD